jgi:predicted tellurium resistance membrane protein TerC
MLKPKKAKISTAEVLLLIISFVVGVPFPPLLIFAIGGLIYVGVKYLRSEDRTLYLSLERIMRGKSISNS